MVDMVEYYTRHPADACMEICIGGLLSNIGIAFIFNKNILHAILVLDVEYLKFGFVYYLNT